MRPLAILALTATSLAAQSGVEVTETGRDQLRLTYQGEPADLALAASQVWLLGAPLEGEVDWQVVEAQIARRVPWHQVEEYLQDVAVDGPAQLGNGGQVRGQRLLELTFPPRRRR